MRIFIKRRRTNTISGWHDVGGFAFHLGIIQRCVSHYPNGGLAENLVVYTRCRCRPCLYSTLVCRYVGPKLIKRLYDYLQLPSFWCLCWSCLWWPVGSVWLWRWPPIFEISRWVCLYCCQCLSIWLLGLQTNVFLDHLQDVFWPGAGTRCVSSWARRRLIMRWLRRPFFP